MKNAPGLPPLPTLRVFECVGRLQSFRAAGEELCISQSAVSYHIKQLEQDLGVQLFLRQPRGISFTDQGRTYFDLIGQSFRLLREGTDALRSPNAPARLKVSVLPSFAAGWLVQRLGGFRAENPALDVVLDPGLGLANLDRGDADLAIRYGRGDWDDVDCELLLPERLCPVASPALLRRGPPVRAARDLATHTLLQVSRPYEWDLWAEAMGIDLDAAKTLQLTDYNIVLQAATDGLGIAMGREFLVRARVEAGVLATAFGSWVALPLLGYWLCLPRHGVKPQARAFTEWMRGQIRLQG
ncbi:MAG: LysR substrate-binding domain-containing protein [Pseudomonadota bacterium]